MIDVAYCRVCSSAIHEQKNCRYRDLADLFRSLGIPITARQMREQDESWRPW